MTFALPRFGARSAAALALLPLARDAQVRRSVGPQRRTCAADVDRPVSNPDEPDPRGHALVAVHRGWMVRPMRVLATCVLAFTGAAVRCAGAQVGAHPQLSPICQAGAGPRISADDHLIVVRAGTAWNRHGYTVEELIRITQHANALRQHFAPPETLGDVPILAKSWLTTWGGAPFEHSAVNGMLVLVMKPGARRLARKARGRVRRLANASGNAPGIIP